MRLAVGGAAEATPYPKILAHPKPSQVWPQSSLSLAVHFFLVALESDAGDAQANHRERRQYFPVGSV